MAVIFRPVTKEDLDRLFAVEEVEKIEPYFGKGNRKYSDFLDQGRCIAIDEETGSYLINLPQLDRMQGDLRYVLVCDGKVIVSEAGSGGIVFPIEYISPFLLGRLEKLTPFLKESFAAGGLYLSGGHRDDWDRALGEQMHFLIRKLPGA